MTNPTTSSDMSTSASINPISGASGNDSGLDHLQSMGTLIAARCRLSPRQVSDIVDLQKTKNLRFGEAAVELKYATRADVLWALSQQFDYSYSTHDEHLSHELVTARSPFGTQAECFRDLRSQIMIDAMNDDDHRRALALISSDVGDGKSYFAANLAIAFSQLGGRTLLIDADMRTPRQHEIFNIDNSSGLSHFLIGRSDEEVIRPVDALPNLFVLPLGTVPPNPLELVQRPAFSLLIQEALTKFDFVLIDTPAASLGSDAKVIAAHAGAALVIGRQHKTRIDSLNKLVSGLQKTPCQIVGVVMNQH